MLNAYSRGITLQTDGIIPFESVTLNKGCSDALVGTSSIQLKKAGVYRVEFYAQSLAATAGNISVTMLTNGTAKTGDTTTVTGATTTSTVDVPIITLVQVPLNDCKCNCCTSPTVIQFQNIGVATTSDVNVVVTKLC